MDEIVVLLHGLGRTHASMTPLAIAARCRGYRVINWRYRSNRLTIAENASAFAHKVAPRLASASRVHFVTHSLGGIIVRQFLAEHTLPNLGRVVMLAPPNGGSEVADVMQNWLTPVKPLRELGTGAASVPCALPPAQFPVGVIAGSRSHSPLFSRWMNDVPNDGVVSVERTRLAGMKDFVVLHRTHTFLPWAPDAMRQVFNFIEAEAFAH
ncbi:MAG TPA: alpha/beta fold hydrolase [Thermoanaerobaculia bacterium]|nr:alpha/beta fold hydrolase [Thermoanaerobaculia bacterium]